MNTNPNPFDKNNPLGGQPQKIFIKPSDTSPVVCPCGCAVFNQGILLRKVSVLLGGDGQPQPMPVIYCVKCFKPVPEFLHPDLRKTEIDV